MMTDHEMVIKAREFAVWHDDPEVRHFATWVEDALGQRAALRKFAADVMKDYPEYSPDGPYLHEMAIKHEILFGTEVTEPCGEQCACNEYGDFPLTCYRLSDFVKDDLTTKNTTAAK